MRKLLFTLILGFILGAGLTSLAMVTYNNQKMARIWKRYAVDPGVVKKARVAASIDGKIDVYVASSLDRIFKDGMTLVKPVFSNAADISLARNEHESFQVVVRADKQLLEDVQLSVSDLVDPQTGQMIKQGSVSWRVVGYVPTKKPYYPVKYVGLWPDPLLPGTKTNVPPGITQPFWVTVYAPAGTAPGRYEGTVTVTARDVPAITVPVRARVYDFDIPKASRLKTAFDFYGHITYKQFPQREDEPDRAYKSRLGEINDKFIITMLQYRMNPILNLDPTLNEEMANVDRYLLHGLNNFSIGKRGGTFANNWPGDQEAIDNLEGLYRTYGEMLKLNNFLNYNYIYTWDEGEIGNPQVSKITAMIHRAYPGLKNMVCYHGIWDPDERPDWGKDIDIWTFQIDNFHEGKMRKLQALGKEIWMYISGPGGTGAPNLAVDFDSMDYRIVAWLCWKYDIKGFLYWCVNWWPTVDPFKNAANTRWGQNGNGLLFYPGKDGPLASLRAEVFRDGMEDYEYIQRLYDTLKYLKQNKQDEQYKEYFEESMRLLKVDDSIVVSPTEFTRDTEHLIGRRNQIAEQIEEFRKMIQKEGPDPRGPESQ